MQASRGPILLSEAPAALARAGASGLAGWLAAFSLGRGNPPPRPSDGLSSPSGGPAPSHSHSHRPGRARRVWFPFGWAWEGLAYAQRRKGTTLRSSPAAVQPWSSTCWVDKPGESSTLLLLLVLLAVSTSPPPRVMALAQP